MNKTTRQSIRASQRTENATRILLPALFAVSGGLASLPASALELGEATVESTLGQPLRASVAFALGPNETMTDSCVSLQRGDSASGLPNLSSANVSIGNGVISIRGASAVREPLLSMRVNVRCPYTPRISREYMLFIDPAAPVAASQPAAAVTNVASAAGAQSTRPVQATSAPVTAAPKTPATPIANASRYRVQAGESLSEIAQRIENRPVGLWPAVNAIFAANPAAFIDNDPNKLKAGSWLTIPDLGAGHALTVVTAATWASRTAEAASKPVAAVPASAEVDTSVADNASSNLDGQASDTSADLQPGDVILDSDNPFVTPIGAEADSTVTIPDTEIAGPATTAGAPNVPTASIRTQPATAAEPSGTNWLLWLAGGGVALIAALLLFGLRRKPRFDATPLDAATAPQRRQTDTGEMPAMTEFEAELSGEYPAKVDAIDVVDNTLDLETHLSDDCPTEENLALDADLVVGTGLQQGSDVDVAQDFGFAATTNIDLELPEEMSSGGAPTVETDMIPPLNIDTESILESEVLPDQNDDDYDMSVIVDATQMPDPEDVTERDLEAIAVETDSDDLITGDYTVSQEVDYKIVEQDYEDELTATQALNKEIARAAAELADRMDESDDATSQMTIASVTDIDIAAENDDLGDTDATAVDEAITVNMTDDKTIEMVADDKTVEMPSDDRTIEMPAKRGKTGTKGG